jgi:hypothetical protein
MKVSFNFFKSWNKPLGITLEDCLTKDEAGKLKKLNLDQLLEMDSADRIEAMTKVIDREKAIFVNNRFEKDLILKNQKEALTNWINKSTDVEPKWKKEILRRILDLDRVLNKKEMDVFLEELAELKLGIGVTLEETENILRLSNKAKKIKEDGGSENEYQDALKEFNEYVAMLKQN